MTFIDFCKANRIKWFALCSGTFRNPYCLYKNHERDILKAHDLLKVISRQLRKKAIKSESYEQTLSVMEANFINVHAFSGWKSRSKQYFATKEKFERLKLDLIRLANAIDIYVMRL